MVQETRPDLAHTAGFVTVLHGVYTKEECQGLVELSEQQGYTPATVTRYDGIQVRS